MAHGTRFTVGTVVAIDFKDGCGFTVGTIVGESYKYSAWSGVEYTYFQVKPAAGQGLDEPFQVTLEELHDFGVALPTRVLVSDGQIDAAPGWKPAEIVSVEVVRTVVVQ